MDKLAVAKQQMQDQQEVNEIAGQVCRILMDNMQIPKFSSQELTVAIAAKIMKKDIEWVRRGIVDGWLPIGIAAPSLKGKKTSFYVSPKMFWDVTGYVWRGDEV